LRTELLREHKVTKVQLQAFMACLPFLMKLLPLKQILSWMDIEKIVINKDNPATNMPSLRNRNADFDKKVIPGQTNDRRSELWFDGRSILNQ
jgi:hypothetical protein